MPQEDGSVTMPVTFCALPTTTPSTKATQSSSSENRRRSKSPPLALWVSSEPFRVSRSWSRVMDRITEPPASPSPFMTDPHSRGVESRLISPSIICRRPWSNEWCGGWRFCCWIPCIDASWEMIHLRFNRIRDYCYRNKVCSALRWRCTPMAISRVWSDTLPTVTFASYLSLDWDWTLYRAGVCDTLKTW